MARRKASPKAGAASPSVLLPATQRVLKQALIAGDRLVPPKEDDAADERKYAELRAWLKTQPHTRECRCKDCQRREPT